MLKSSEIVARFVMDLENPEAGAPTTPENARESLIEWRRYVTNGYYRPLAVHRLLAEKLEQVERGELRRLIINMPPQHGKSETATKAFPSYYLGRNPQKRVAITSYGADLAVDFGRANRDAMEQFGEEVFGVQVSPKSSAADRWDLLGRRGGMVSVGVGGPLTGRPANLIIVDDPYKDREEADSPTIREKVWNWYTSVVQTRQTYDAAIVVIQTRWHEDDLSGRLIRDMKSGAGEHWEVLNIPCEAEAEDDPLGRAPGETLCPDPPFNKDRAWADNIKKVVGAYVWAALFQGRPSPLEGGILKRFWWRFWHPPGVSLPPVPVPGEDGKTVLIESIPLPKLERKAQSWDMAFKDTKTSAYVVGQVWGAAGANRFMLDQLREKLAFPATIEAVKSTTERHPDARAKWVEDKANGPAVISTLQGQIAGLIAVQPDGSKIARAHAASPSVQSGNVYLPHPALAPWVWGFIEECAAFPNGAYADQVDTFTQAILQMETSKKSGTWGR